MYKRQVYGGVKGEGGVGGWLEEHSHRNKGRGIEEGVSKRGGNPRKGITLEMKKK